MKIWEYHHKLVCDAMLLDEPGNEWRKKEKEVWGLALSTTTCQNLEGEEDWEGKAGKSVHGLLVAKGKKRAIHCFKCCCGSRNVRHESWPLNSLIGRSLVTVMGIVSVECWELYSKSLHFVMGKTKACCVHKPLGWKQNWKNEWINEWKQPPQPLVRDIWPERPSLEFRRQELGTQSGPNQISSRFAKGCRNRVCLCLGVGAYITRQGGHIFLQLQGS